MVPFNKTDNFIILPYCVFCAYPTQPLPAVPEGKAEPSPTNPYRWKPPVGQSAHLMGTVAGPWGRRQVPGDGGHPMCPGRHSRCGGSFRKRQLPRLQVCTAGTAHPSQTPSPALCPAWAPLPAVPSTTPII